MLNNTRRSIAFLFVSCSRRPQADEASQGRGTCRSDGIRDTPSRDPSAIHHGFQDDNKDDATLPEILRAFITHSRMTREGKCHAE
jgi:hypothetical protein